MLKVYSAPRTRSLRVVWLLEELEVPYELVPVEFKPTIDRFFIQDTPTGKIPTLEDGETLICESGAILEYILETVPGHQLAPEVGSPDRGRYLQWLHFSESTAWGPIGIMVWLTVYRADASENAALIGDARTRVANTLEFVDGELAEGPYLLGQEFSAADIMLSFTLLAAAGLGLVDESSVHIKRYLETVRSRPAFQEAALQVGGFEG